ncbi:MAG: hypothetical protein FWH14_05935 [Oscillospiraceae bacterium]|nr:hypothetical protein [Oscillospiraceae bacterium]
MQAPALFRKEGALARAGVFPRRNTEIIVCKPLFPSGEGCRRSGGVVFPEVTADNG